MAVSRALSPPPTTRTSLPPKSLGSCRRLDTLSSSSPGTPSLRKFPRTPDGGDHPARAHRAAAGDDQLEQPSLAAHLLDARHGRGDPLLQGLGLELGHQRLLDLGAELQVAGGRHVGRISEDRLAAREVDDGRERLGRLEQLEAQAGFPGGEGRGHAADPGADDGDVEGLPVTAGLFLLLKARIAADVLDRPGAAVGGELQQRDAGEVADDVQPGNAAAVVRVDLGQLLDHPGGPAGVQPLRVRSQRSEHPAFTSPGS